jgi:hypothetical protein
LATVPEGYSAALCLVGLASLNCFTLFHRGWGAAALCAATLCRYETWPLAVAFAICTTVDVRQQRLSPAALGTAAGAALGICGWLLHGILNHGSAVFFLTRVAQYKQALGDAAHAGILWNLLQYPALLVRAEPELALAVVCGLLWVPSRTALAARFQRPLSHAALILGFLMLGACLDGVATHHPERSLLAIWLLALLLAADIWSSLFAMPARRHLPALAAFTLAAVAITVLRDRVVPQEGFVDRRDEVSMGLMAHRIVARSPSRIAVDTPDYGYHAVIAALNLPGMAQPVTHHDPRLDEAQADLDKLTRTGAGWLIADKNGPLAQAAGTVYAENPRFVLLNLNER